MKKTLLALAVSLTAGSALAGYGDWNPTPVKKMPEFRAGAGLTTDIFPVGGIQAAGHFVAEWKSDINDKLAVRFGPKATVGLGGGILWGAAPVGNAFIAASFEANLDFKAVKYQPFVGVEVGAGPNFLFNKGFVPSYKLISTWKGGAHLENGKSTLSGTLGLNGIGIEYSRYFSF